MEKAEPPHGVHQAQDGAALCGQIDLQLLGVDIGDRDGGRPGGKISSAKMVNRIFLRSSGDLPGVPDGLDHNQTTSTLPPAASIFPWRRRRRREA